MKAESGVGISMWVRRFAMQIYQLHWQQVPKTYVTSIIQCNFENSQWSCQNSIHIRKAQFIQDSHATVKLNVRRIMNDLND